jgi:hypothetical protein
MAVFLIIDKIIIPEVFNIKNSGYIDRMNQWGQRPVRENILRILGFGYSLALKNIPLIDNIVNPIIARNSPENLALRMNAISTISLIAGSMLLLPLVMLFFIQLAVIMRKTIPAKRRFLYMLAGSGIPLSIMFLSIAGGATTPTRSLWALPLAMAFMFFFLTTHYKKKVAAVVACLALLVAAHNAQITAQLFYSDYIRYNEDVRLAYDLDRLISHLQPEGKKLPVALFGKYEAALKFRTNFIQGEVNGHSFFEWDRDEDSNIYFPTERGLAFMKSLGINYDVPSEEQLKQAIFEAKHMPAYPNPYCIKRTKDFIVVKIAESRKNPGF